MVGIPFFFRGENTFAHRTAAVGTTAACVGLPRSEGAGNTRTKTPPAPSHRLLMALWEIGVTMANGRNTLV